MPTVVYSYGVHYKWAKRLPQSVADQLFWGHRLREHMVCLEHDYEAEKKRIWSAHPQIADIEAQIYQADQDIADAETRLKQQKTLQSTRSPSGPDADQARTDSRAAKKRRTALRAARRDAIATVYASVPNTKDALAAALDDYRQADKNTYDTFVRGRGLDYGTHYEVKQAHKTAMKNLKAKRLRGEPAQLRHHAFDATGIIAVHLRAGSTRKNSRDPQEIADTAGPHRNNFTLPYLDPASFEQMTGAQRRHTGRVTARMKIGAEVLEIPIQMHRPLPADGVIKSVMLVVKRVGTRRVVTLNLRVTVPEPEPVDEDTTVAVHFGWRAERGQKIRAMTFTADAPIPDWNSIKVDPRYAPLAEAMEVSSDGCSGTVSVPKSWLEGISTREELTTERDHSTNAIKQSLIDWLKLVGPVDHPSRIDPDAGNPEQLTAAKVAQWKNPKRLARLARDWRDTPPVLSGGAQIAAELEVWRAFDKKFLDSRAGAERRARARRDHLYSNVAKLLTESYGTIVMDEVDHAKLAELPGDDETITNEHSQRLGRQRANIAAATLRVKIEQTAAREGVEVRRIDLPAVTLDCAYCGARNIREGGKMTIECTSCGVTYDVDSNAVTSIALVA